MRHQQRSVRGVPVSWVRRFRRVTIVPLTVVGTLGLLLAACGGGSGPPGVASLGATTTSTTYVAQGTSHPSRLQNAVTFSQCMRSHGVVNFPSPVTQASGKFTLDITPAMTHSPHFASAFAYCRTLVPSSRQALTITPADQADYLKAAACIRSHGFASFPDPTFTNGTVHFPATPGIDQNSPQFQKAIATCHRLIPPGLPYSGSG
jgi:hypothetical protein